MALTHHSEGTAMHCSGCNLENPPNAKFCIGCGLPLAHGCSRCTYQNPVGAKFCQECGTRLTAPERSANGKADATPVENQAPEKVSIPLVDDTLTNGERKTVTAL